jgi:hypothetical protein
MGVLNENTPSIEYQEFLLKAYYLLDEQQGQIFGIEKSKSSIQKAMDVTT